MRGILLETSAYLAWAAGHVGIRKHVTDAEKISLSVITGGELRAGFSPGRTSRAAQVFGEFLMSPRVGVLNVTPDTAERYAVIYNDLRRQGTPISANDIWIAACAMEHGLPVITCDRHFERVRSVIVRWHDPAEVS